MRKDPCCWCCIKQHSLHCMIFFRRIYKQMQHLFKGQLLKSYQKLENSHCTNKPLDAMISVISPLQSIGYIKHTMHKIFCLNPYINFRFWCFFLRYSTQRPLWGFSSNLDARRGGSLWGKVLISKCQEWDHVITCRPQYPASSANKWRCQTF